MPNGRTHKTYNDYGPHKYANRDGTSDCQYECGCWMGPARSGGPLGVSSFGHCPNNPLDGERQEGINDYTDCVEGRIRWLEEQLGVARQAEKLVAEARRDTKIALLKKVKTLEEETQKLKNKFSSVRELAQSIVSRTPSI